MKLTKKYFRRNVNKNFSERTLSSGCARKKRKNYGREPTVEFLGKFSILGNENYEKMRANIDHSHKAYRKSFQFSDSRKILGNSG